jgi:hypothetical protein
LEDEWRKNNNMLSAQEENGYENHADALEVVIQFLKMQWSWIPWSVHCLCRETKEKRGQ